MSAHAASANAGNQRLLGEMLHSLSQPLTSLRCALELSVTGDRNLQSVSAALEQTDAAIRMVRLMREYLDSETNRTEMSSIALMPALQSVGEDLASIAQVKGVHLAIAGSSDSTLQVEEPQLRLALQYMIQSLVDRQMAGNKVILLVRDNAVETVVWAEAEHTFHLSGGVEAQKRLSVSTGLRRSNKPDRDSNGATMRRVQLAIATRVLGNAGAEVKIDESTPSFVIRIPRRNRPTV